MLKDPRNILWIVPLAMLVTLPLWQPLAADFLSPERKGAITQVASLAAPQVLTSTAMDGVQFEQSSHGVREWSLTANSLHSLESGSDMEFEDVNARFYGTEGKNKETNIRSRKANYNTNTRELTLLGNVVVQNQLGYEMQTEYLEYDPADKEIRTTKTVRIKGKNIEVSGKRLLYDTVSGNYSLAGNVVCRVW